MLGSNLIRGRRLPAAMALVCVLGSSSGARAQSDELRAGARAAATAGANAFMERRWADAIDLFGRAESIVHSPVHWLYMARANVKLGRLVQARELYIKIAGEQLAPSAPSAFQDAKKEGEAELAELEPRVPYVSVVVQGGEGRAVSVTMDGSEVPSALLGVPRPVDPGTHEFVATADGMRSAPIKLDLAEGRRETVTLNLEPATATAAPGAIPSGVAPAPEPSATQAAPEEDQGGGGSNALRIGAFVGFGVGAVGLAAGTLFALQAKSKIDDANELCDLPGGDCPSSRREEIEGLDDDARSGNTLSLISFVVGGLGAATGVTLLVLSSGRSGSEAASSYSHDSLSVRLGPGTASLAGRF